MAEAARFPPSPTPARVDPLLNLRADLARATAAEGRRSGQPRREFPVCVRQRQPKAAARSRRLQVLVARDGLPCRLHQPAARLRPAEVRSGSCCVPSRLAVAERPMSSVLRAVTANAQWPIKALPAWTDWWMQDWVRADLPLTSNREAQPTWQLNAAQPRPASVMIHASAMLRRLSVAASVSAGCCEPIEITSRACSRSDPKRGMPRGRGVLAEWPSLARAPIRQRSRRSARAETPGMISRAWRRAERCHTKDRPAPESG